jgi:NADH dehydrogenase
MLIVTGANGNLGRRLVAAGEHVRALVRRESAVAAVRAANPSIDIRVVDYLDVDAMTAALESGQRVVHLVGILKESATSRYEIAHEATTRALVAAAAAAGVGRILSLGIVGSDPSSANACLRSKGRADALLLESPVPATVLRLPMVLGEGDYAAAALARRARKRINWLLRPSSLEQPLYAGDVIEALERLARDASFARRIVELGGPELLTRRELTVRAARVLGRSTRVVGVPLAVGMAAAALAERLPNPPVTRAMLGVLDHDDRVDNRAVLDALALTLTPLDEALARCLRPA